MGKDSVVKSREIASFTPVDLITFFWGGDFTFINKAVFLLLFETHLERYILSSPQRHRIMTPI